MADWRSGVLNDDDDIESWMARRANDVSQRNDSELLGRDAWAAATGTGQNLTAPTPSDVRALGVAIACAPQLPVAGGEFLPRVVAAGRGAEDAILFGHGDNLEAGLRSIPTLLSGGSVGSDYNRFLNEAHDQDRYDEARYPLSRQVGELAGTGAMLLATDGAAGAMVPRFAVSAARAMPALTDLERGRLALGGAGAGVLGQGVTDILSGHPSGWRDYAGAALGGATTAATGARLGPVQAAALGAGVASTADGLLNGHLDPEGIEHSMTAAGYLGGFGRWAGENYSNALSNHDKGDLGEALSRIRAFSRDNPVVASQVRQKLANGKTAILDHQLSDGSQDFLESKFGPRADLTTNQRAFQKEFPDRMRVDYWMPSHVGQVTGGALSIFGIPAVDWANPNRQSIWQ